MKGEAGELLFKLRPETCEAAGRARKEMALALASLARSPHLGAAAALGSLAFDLARTYRHVGGSFALDAAALESLRRTGEQMRAAVAEIVRPDGHFAQSIKIAQEAGRHFAEWYASLPEEEREEIRRAREDAPPCGVDVNANGAGVM